MSTHITFHGGAGSVTGVNILVETDSQKFLVDCGLRQREHICDSDNYAPFAYNPADIDVLFVTHAHADHIGRIPKLVRDGFKGAIISTEPTRDLAAIMFDDALSLMTNPEHAQCAPLYSKEDVVRSLELWKTYGYRETFSALNGVETEFLDAGHILGSAMVSCTKQGKRVLFTGDLGNIPEPLLEETQSPEGTDYLVMESVYGDRLHEKKEERRGNLKAAIELARRKQGTLLIPSFSIERTQILLYEINSMVESREIQPIDVYLDAPLAIRVTGIYAKYREYLNAEVRGRYEKGDDPFSFDGLTLTPKVSASREIANAKDPKIIIAGAGMSVGGRIRSHEKEYLSDSNATILFVGYQSPGSLGRRILDGASRVQIEGENVPVKAQVLSVMGYSGHADRDQLMMFVEKTAPSLKKVFVVMGETKSSMFLAQRINDFLGVDAICPEGKQALPIDW